jgi:sugar phosphate isomerase/epimerase
MMRRRDLLTTIPAAAAVAQSQLLAGTRSDDMHGKKARLKPGICAYSYRKELGSGKLKYEDLVRIAVENNTDGLDMTVYWMPNHTPSFLMPLRRYAYINGVEIYSISVRTDMCQKNQNDQFREVALLKYWVDVAAKLGAGHIRVFGGRVPDGATEADAVGWVSGILKASADYAGNNGVILGLENHGGITARAERIVEIVEKVDHPYVGINLDTANFRQDPIPQIKMCLPYAVNAQFKVRIADEQGNRVKSDWDMLAGLFAKTGYKGYLAVEYEDKEPTETAMPRLLGELRKICDKYNNRVVS